MKQEDAILAKECSAQGFLTPERAEEALLAAQQKGAVLRDHLLKEGLISEEQLLVVFSKLYNLPVVDVSTVQPDGELLKKVPVRFASYYKVVPVRLDGKVVELACAQPLDIKFQDEIRIHLGLEPRIVLAGESEIIKAQNRIYGLAADMVERLSKVAPKRDSAKAAADEISDIEPGSDEASITRLVNQILLDAYQKRATDIHIEPYRNKLRVRYRIDGVLIDANIPDAARQFMPAIVSRIKIMSNLSIVEKRLPQDGSAVVKTKDQKLDLRISAIPTPRGESMVIRILPTNVTLLGLEHLGLEMANLRQFRALVKKPHGIVLVTGPTGSGKTTTLYACLHEINDPTRKIITLEDPVEYEVDGITQIQVNPRIEFSFAAGLRSVLRHDPDIIMVGEIRDVETAEIAIRTALTGHMVFSTLHTNDAASGVTRLIEMGLEPFLVTSSIEAFVAQRLVRRVCPKCKEEVKTPLLEIREEIAESLKIKPEDAGIYRGRGCSYCNQTGFYGRTAIYEIMTFNDHLRQAILERSNAEQIKQIAMRTGMRTLRQDGWKKVSDGITTPEEVMNVTVKDHEVELPAVPAPEKAVTVAVSAPVIPVKAEGGEGDGAVREKIILQNVLEEKNEYDSRIYARLKIKANIRYSVYHQDRVNLQKFRTNDVQHSSITQDVSAGGVRFASGYALPVGTILDVTIQVPGLKDSVHSLMKICRVEDDVFSAMFYLVAFFLDISSSDRSRLQEFIDQKLKEDV